MSSGASAGWLATGQDDDEVVSRCGLGGRWLSVVCCRNRGMNLAAWAERNGVARVTAWATTQRIQIDNVVTEVKSALNGRGRKFLALLCDPSESRIVVEHRDRFCQFGSEYVQAALAALGRELVVVDSAEVDDDLVRDMTEILPGMCARLYGKRAAQNRAKRAVAAATDAGKARRRDGAF